MATYDQSMARLDQEQRQAATHNARRLVIEAVPGSGKTTTIVSRVAWLMREIDVRPHRIVLTTFTNAAVDDIKQRMAELFEDVDMSRVHVSTIHSLANMAIRHYHARIGTPMPQLVNGALLRQKVREVALRKTDRFLTDEEISDIETIAAYHKNLDAKPKPKEATFEAFDLYEQAKRELGPNLIDYDDMMLYGTRIVEQDEATRAYMQALFDFWLIDEAQDCSPIQHSFVDAVAHNADVTFVGDTDQSIYAFRGAKPELLERIMEEPETTRVDIKTNYRSDRLICNTADAFMGHGTVTKHMEPVSLEKGSITVKRHGSKRAEYKTLLEFAQAATKGHDTAILYRDSDTAIPLVSFLDHHGVEFALRGGTDTFFTSRPVSDALAWLTLAKRPDDTKAFMRLYSKFGIYAKRTEAERACTLCKPSERLFEVLSRVLQKPFSKRRAIDADRLLRRIEHLGPRRAIQLILNSHYGEYLEEMGGGRKTIILMELAKGTTSLDNLTEKLDETRNSMARHKYAKSALTLSTVHSAKGLEWDRVAIANLDDKAFPKETPIIHDANPQVAQRQEKNLMYVALTRARHEILVCSSKRETSMYLERVDALSKILAM